jgi:23S rRNA A1618 N6-methylase RlmF
LFLDQLWKEFKTAKNNINKLKAFHKKIAFLRFLDPACGCGNFLVITYRELRLLEIEIIKELQKGQQVTDVFNLILCDVDRFYGIEYEEFPAQIAQVAMWLIDHQMNMLVSQEFGEYFVRLPLRKSAKIINGNALRTDWDSIIEFLPWESKTDREKFDYILGNPPFIGSKMMTQQQRKEIAEMFDNADGCGIMDYVTAWYAKAAKYLQKHYNAEKKFDWPNTRIAFVSTNSIAQGEQVGLLWQYLISRFGITINFAHTTFRWSNEARGNAAVYCVIIGFAKDEEANKRIYLYDDIKGNPHEVTTSHINPYLVEGKDVFIRHRQHPIGNVFEMNFGNMPLDGGNLLLTDEEKNELLSKEPEATKFIKPLISAREFLNNEKRWCLWLVNAVPSELRKLPLVLERIEKVKQFRLASIAPSTQKFASAPSLFRDKNNPETCIVVPRVSSENRKYIPMGFFDKTSIISDTCMSIPNGTLFHFGIITSEMHMTWVRYTCGRLESRFRYSKDIVYNNYPWPETPTKKQKETVEKAAQKVLDARAQFPNSSLADLYDPLTMPPALVKAHQELDKSVDLCYRPQPFVNVTKRIEFLFELYDKYTAGLFREEKKGKKKQN